MRRMKNRNLWTRPAQAETPAPVERIIERKRGGFPALIGGVLAACLGFMSARTEVLDPYLPDFLRSEDKTVSLSERLDVAQNELAAARDQIGVLKANWPRSRHPLKVSIYPMDAALVPFTERIERSSPPDRDPDGDVVESAAFETCGIHSWPSKPKPRLKRPKNSRGARKCLVLASVQSLQTEAEERQAEAARRKNFNLLVRRAMSKLRPRRPRRKHRAALAQISTALASGVRRGGLA